MKRMLLLLVLLCLPSLGFAKYCPSCLQTFQGESVRGYTRSLYHWLINSFNPKNPIQYKDFKRLFNTDVQITVNGNHVAHGIPEAYTYLLKMRQTQPLIRAHLDTILAQDQMSALKYQTITQRRGIKYRTLVIAILIFKAHKLTSWNSVSHIQRVGSWSSVGVTSKQPRA